MMMTMSIKYFYFWFHLLLTPSFFKLGQATKEVNFSDNSFVESSPKKQKFQFHCKREREEEQENNYNSKEVFENSFEYLNSSKEEAKKN